MAETTEPRILAAADALAAKFAVDRHARREIAAELASLIERERADAAREAEARTWREVPGYRAALEAIRRDCRYLNDRGTTHHEDCRHPGCVADRALRGRP